MKRSEGSWRKQRPIFVGVVFGAIIPILLLLPAGREAENWASPALGDDPSACAGSSLVNVGASANQEAVLADAPTFDSSPIRCLSDPYPEFNGITVDPSNNEVVASDGNTKALVIYDRRTGNQSLDIAESQRMIHGQSTGIGYVAGVAVDPARREYFTVNNDVEDRLVVFSRSAEGNALPVRVLYTPHQVYGVALDSDHDELAITVQELNALLVYKRESKGLDAPIRVIMGPAAGMGDPRGVFVDATNNEIIVSNHGNYHEEGSRYPYANELKPLLPSKGRYQPPSITVYPRLAQGNQTPSRTIQGPNTHLAWPMGIHVDLVNNEIAVANNGENSVLIFRRTEGGDVKPVRVLAGPDTNLDLPMGVYVDPKNNELWVANFGNHSLNVYARTASGNAIPKRIIRSAPAGTPVVGFGNPMAIAYDAARQEVLVPN